MHVPWEENANYSFSVLTVCDGFPELQQATDDIVGILIYSHQGYLLSAV